MSIRNKLLLCFLSILVLFGINYAVYSVGNRTNVRAFDELDRRMRRQALISEAKSELQDLQKQISLVGQLADSTEVPAMLPEEIADFQDRARAIAQKLSQVRDLQLGESTELLDLVESNFEDLAASWLIFYQKFGREHIKALMELARTSDPLSAEVINRLVPELESAEVERVVTARRAFNDSALKSARLSGIIFGLTPLVAMLVAFLFSRHLTSRLGDLKLQAAMIGLGQLDRRITLRGGDELESLATGFNQMADHILQARDELTEANEALEDRRKEANDERRRAQRLLRNILPDSIAEELQSEGKVIPRYYEDVTVLFTDFRGFTLSTQELAADELVDQLHRYFKAFDEIMGRYGIEKLKTIGDAFMCVAGLPQRKPSHPVDATMAALEMAEAVDEIARKGTIAPWQVRIGLNTGPVIAGVVGIKKFAFDIWGHTVNIAARMESAGVPGRVNLSHETYARVKDFFDCEERGLVSTKEKKLPMYLAKGVTRNLRDDSGELPPAAFRNRYRVYFQSDPPAFPAFLVNGPAATQVFRLMAIDDPV